MNGVPTIIPQTAAPGTSLALFLSSQRNRLAQHHDLLWVTGTPFVIPLTEQGGGKFKDAILSPGQVVLDIR
jgi:hypothetical protein